MTKLCMIAAVGANNELGLNNKLLWHLPDDFKRFKELTTGHKIIMGRKTFESFPKPLPKRTHIILTRDKKYEVPYADCRVVHSFEAALELVQGEALAYVIGGGEIYTLGMAHADSIELTRVHASFKADAFFPKINETDWTVVKEEYHGKDDNHAYDFTYITYKRSS